MFSTGKELGRISDMIGKATNYLVALDLLLAHWHWSSEQWVVGRVSCSLLLSKLHSSTNIAIIPTQVFQSNTCLKELTKSAK